MFDNNNMAEMMKQRALMSQMANKPAAPPPSPAGPTAPPPGLASALTSPKPGTNTGIVPPPGLPGPAAAPAAPANPLAGIDTSKWDTDGYAAPGAIKAAKGGAMSGWDQTKWANADNQHPKYVVGRILSNYEDTPEGLHQAMGDIQAAYPGASLENDGKSGKINIPGLGTIDVGVSFGSGGHHGWAWNTGEGGGSGGGAGAGAGGGMNLFGDLGGMTSDSSYKRMMARMGQLTPELMNQQALMSQLTQ